MTISLLLMFSSTLKMVQNTCIFLLILRLFFVELPSFLKKRDSIRYKCTSKATLRDPNTSPPPSISPLLLFITAISMVWNLMCVYSLAGTYANAKIYEKHDFYFNVVDLLNISVYCEFPLITINSTLYKISILLSKSCCGPISRALMYREDLYS